MVGVERRATPYWTLENARTPPGIISPGRGTQVLLMYDEDKILPPGR